MSKYNFIFSKAPVPFSPTHSSFQRNYALHRSVGDIPGCVPAVDVFVEHSEEEVHAHLLASADHYGNAVRCFIDGGFSGTGYERERAMYAEANNFKKLMFIRNPASPTKDYT